MILTESLLADLRSRGIDFESDGTRLRYRPAFLVLEAEQRLLLANKAEFIELLRAPVNRCPSCGWPLDSRNRCSKCFDRLCVDCGRFSGSYFIQRCAGCGHAFKEGAMS